LAIFAIDQFNNFLLQALLVSKIQMFFLMFNYIAIEDDYLGPKLEEDKVTLDFMMKLMACYKNQGKLHRKYAYKVGTTIRSVTGAQVCAVPDFAGSEAVVHDAAFDGGRCHSR
jgi:hypothetical protein